MVSCIKQVLVGAEIRMCLLALLQKTCKCSDGNRLVDLVMGYLESSPTKQAAECQQPDARGWAPMQVRPGLGRPRPVLPQAGEASSE